MKSPKDTFAEAIRLLDKGDVTAAGDLIIELGPFFRPQMVSQGTNHLSVPHPFHPDRYFIVGDEGNGPYLLPEATINWEEYGKPFRGNDGKAANWCRTPTTAGHYVCGDCGHSVHPTGCVPPLGWVMCDTYWLCPTCADRRQADE